MKQRDLWDNLPTELVPNADLCTSRHRGADTSKEAFETTPESTRKHQREIVLDLVQRKAVDGVTCEEASFLLQIPYTSASGRLAELRRLALIHDSGARRRTTHGKNSRVYLAGPGEESHR